MEKQGIPRALHRLQKYIDTFPDVNVWVLSSNKITADMYWKRISENINTEKIRPLLITSKLDVLDGLNPKGTLILVCGKWWENPNACLLMNSYFKKADNVIPIAETP